MSLLIETERDFHDLVQAGDDVFVLFYASWCPFSQKFLPAYEKLARDREHKFARILVDNKEGLCRQFGIDVYPTVIFFQSGRASRRLDGAYHVGLSEEQITELIETCRPGPR